MRAGEALRSRVIAAHHDAPWYMHQGVSRTIELVSRDYW